MVTTADARASKIAVPEAIRARAGTGRIDYESAFNVAADPVGWKTHTARLGPYPSNDDGVHGCCG